METRHLTPRQLLVLVLSVSRESGYEVLPKQKVLDAIRELRTGAPAFVPKLDFILSGMKHCCKDLEEAFNGLHLSGAITFNPLDGTISLNEAMSDAEVYKPLHGAQREELFLAMTPYISAFVQQATAADPKASKAKRDPQKY